MRRSPSPPGPHRGGAHPRRRPGAARVAAARRHRGLRAAGRGAGRAAGPGGGRSSPRRAPPTNSAWLRLTAEIDAATEELTPCRSARPPRWIVLLTDARADATRSGTRQPGSGTEALEHRARVRAQLAEVRERLARALAPEAPRRFPRPSTEARRSTTPARRRTAGAHDDDHRGRRARPGRRPLPTSTPGLRPGARRTCATAACAAEQSAGDFPVTTRFTHPTGVTIGVESLRPRRATRPNRVSGYVGRIPSSGPSYAVSTPNRSSPRWTRCTPPS